MDLNFLKFKILKARNLLKMIKIVSSSVLTFLLTTLVDGHAYITVPNGRIPSYQYWVGDAEFSGGLNSQYYYQGNYKSANFLSFNLKRHR
jgi:hypothetical protein